MKGCDQVLGNILIVDDDPVTLHFLAEALKKQGVVVRVRATLSTDGQVDLFFSTVLDEVTGSPPFTPLVLLPPAIPKD